MPGARPSSFGAQLRRYREAAGLSQEDLAERAGLAAKAIGALERGERRRPYPRTVQVLADALRLDDAERRQLIASVPRTLAAAVTDGDLFVGRERELAELAAKLRAAAGGHGGIVMVLGEAGIGKTRLANDFMAIARSQGAVVVCGRAFEGEGQAPYGPWVEAIEGFASQHDSDELRERIGFDAPYIAELAPGLRSRLAGIGRPEALASSDERLRVYGALTRFCSAIGADGPVVVVLDDLHWADRDTLGVVRYMARTLSSSRVLLVGVYRDPEIGVDADHPLMATLAAVRREVACPTIHLGGLGGDEIRTYLDHVAGQSLPPGFVERVERETSGNPFYAREILRHVAGAGVALITAQSPRAFAMTAVPEGVRQVVADRVRRLSPATAQTLREACGFTGGFAFPVLERLTELSEGALLDCLDEAVEAGLLRAPVGDAREYDFAHAIVRHALYEAQSRDRRVRLHRRIAGALEAAYAGHEAEHAAELAVHYHASAELTGASAGLRYALIAADHARAAYAHDRAVTLLGMARDLASEADPATQIDILTRLALAQAETVRSRDAFESAQRALEIMAGTGVTPRVRAEFHAAVARALKASGASAELWEPLVERGLQLLGKERDVLWARLALLRDRYVEIKHGLIGSGLWMGQEADAVAIARASGDESEFASTLEPLEWRTRVEIDAIRERVRTWSRPLAMLQGLQAVVRDLIYKQGDFIEGRRAAEELLGLAQRFGSVSAEAEARAQIAVSSLSTGDFASARVLVAEAEQAIGRLGPSHRLHLVPIGYAVGLGYFLDTDWARLAHAAEAYARTADAQRITTGLAAAAYAALAITRAGRPSDARAWLRDIAAAAEEVPATMYLLNWTLVAAAAAAWDIGLVEVAGAFRRVLSGLAGLGAGPTTYGSVEHAFARMSALTGAHDESRALFAEAARQAGDSGHRPLQAVVAYDAALAARRAGAQDARVETALDRAIVAFETLEMRPWLGRARSLRRVSGAR